MKTAQLVHGSLFLGVNSTRKSANTCAFKVFHGSKETSNLDSSTDRLVIHLAKSGLNSNCISGEMS
jgi:hypothetical protein